MPGHLLQFLKLVSFYTSLGQKLMVLLPCSEVVATWRACSLQCASNPRLLVIEQARCQKS